MWSVWCSMKNTCVHSYQIHYYHESNSIHLPYRCTLLCLRKYTQNSVQHTCEVSSVHSYISYHPLLQSSIHRNHVRYNMNLTSVHSAAYTVSLHLSCISAQFTPVYQPKLLYCTYAYDHSISLGEVRPCTCLSLRPSLGLRPFALAGAWPHGPCLVRLHRIFLEYCLNSPWAAVKKS